MSVVIDEQHLTYKKALLSGHSHSFPNISIIYSGAPVVFETLPRMTNSSEKFCLKWNEFQQNIASSYRELRQDPDFCDVTLVCEDYEQVKAHRIILTACSPFFSTVLKENTHSHPMIYMRGIRAKDLVSIVDYIYHGEANIYQEDLDKFLNIAEELQLKGLAGANYEIEKTKQPKPQTKCFPVQEQILWQPTMHEERDTKFMDTFEDNLIPVVPLNITINEELKTRLDSMMEKSQNEEFKWICTVCGKAVKGTKRRNARKDMRQHIETHIEGLSYPCSICGKESRTSNSYRAHMSINHKKK